MSATKYTNNRGPRCCLGAHQTAPARFGASGGRKRPHVRNDLIRPQWCHLRRSPSVVSGPKNERTRYLAPSPPATGDLIRRQCCHLSRAPSLLAGSRSGPCQSRQPVQKRPHHSHHTPVLPPVASSQPVSGAGERTSSLVTVKACPPARPYLTPVPPPNVIGEQPSSSVGLRPPGATSS